MKATAQVWYAIAEEPREPPVFTVGIPPDCFGRPNVSNTSRNDAMCTASGVAGHPVGCPSAFGPIRVPYILRCGGPVLMLAGGGQLV